MNQKSMDRNKKKVLLTSGVLRQKPYLGIWQGLALVAMFDFWMIQTSLAAVARRSRGFCMLIVELGQLRYDRMDARLLGRRDGRSSLQLLHRTDWTHMLPIWADCNASSNARLAYGALQGCAYYPKRDKRNIPLMYCSTLSSSERAETEHR